VFPGGKPVPTFPETLVIRDAPALGTVFLFRRKAGRKAFCHNKMKRNKIMAAIGQVTKLKDGSYKGELKTLSIRAEIIIVPNADKTSDNQPDYRVFAEGIEVGAAWVRKSASTGKEYVSLSIAAPEFGPKKLYANLGRAAGQDDKNVFALIWNPRD